jgi:hypothetical protein
MEVIVNPLKSEVTNMKVKRDVRSGYLPLKKSHLAFESGGYAKKKPLFQAAFPNCL